MPFRFPFVWTTLLALAACGPDRHAGDTPSDTTPHVAVLDLSHPIVLAGASDPPAFIPVDGHGRIALPGAEVPAWGNVRFVEPLVDFETQELPSDARLDEQWALEDIGAPRAWDVAADASSITVAIVDSGVALAHPDLAGAIWVNEGEEPANGLDDDGNGFVDDVNGWDFVDDDEDPRPASGDSGHGTHVAGVVGATWDNAKGVAGVAPRVRLMTLRAVSARRGTSAAVADAVDYAAENGADVINLSLGGGYSRVLDEALGRAADRGVLIVAATGNDARGSVSFPASSRLPAVLGVGATDRTGRLAAFSNVGPGFDLTAPGVDILSTLPARTYGSLTGTSMAAPHVAGALALALAVHGRGAVSPAALVGRLPAGRGGMPRLDLPSLVDRSASDSTGRISLRRSRLAFTAVSTSRRPPPQTIAVDAATPTPFDIDAPDWVRPGACRAAPCRLSFSVDPSELGAGRHLARVALRAGRTAAAVNLSIELFIGDLEEQVLALEVDGRGRGEERLTVTAGSIVEVRAVRGRQRSAASFSLDGAPVQASRLRGIFPRPGRHRVDATDRDGRTASVVLEIVPSEGSDAPPAVDLPGRER